MSSSDKLDAMIGFLDQLAEVHCSGTADPGVTATVDVSGKLIDLTMPASVRGMRADDLSAAVILAVGRAAAHADEQRSELLALLHSSLTAP